MNELEQAIAEITNRAEHTLKTVISAETAQLAVEALEKQMPKQIDFEGENGSDFGYCPKCKCVVGTNESIYDRLQDGDFYCEYCGQRLE